MHVNFFLFETVFLILQKIEGQADVNPDLKEEVVITLEILKRLEPPDPPCVTGILQHISFLFFYNRMEF